MKKWTCSIRSDKCSHRANPAILRHGTRWKRCASTFCLWPRTKGRAKNFCGQRSAAWPWAKAVQLKIKKWRTAFAHHHLPFIFLSTARQKFLSRPSRSDVFDYFFPCGAKAKHSHKQKVLARAATHFLSCGGGACVAICFLSAPFPRLPSPATPMQAGGGAVAYARVG